MRKPRSTAAMTMALITAAGLVMALSPGVGAATTVKVGPARTYTTIQAGIDAAAAGDVIVVDEGNYTEDLSIPADKQGIELKPAEKAEVVIKGVQHVPVSSPAAVPNIEVLADGVKIHGFTIESPGYESGFYTSGMIVGASNVEVCRNDFLVTPSANVDEISQCFQTYHHTVIPDVDISGLKFEDNNISNLEGASKGYEGVYLNLDTGTGTARVHGNDFEGNIVRAITTERSNTTISRNRVINDLGPSADPNLGGYQGINVGGVNDGSIADVTLKDNKVGGSESGKGFQWGIKLGYDTTSSFSSVSVEYNDVYGNEIGVRVRYGAAGVRVNRNKIHGNSTWGVLNEDATQLDATYNWWGDNSGPAPGGGGDEVSGNIRFDPWYRLYAAASLDGISDCVQSGEFAIESGSSITNTPYLDVLETVTLAVPDLSGNHFISISLGTRITGTDGGNFNANAITASATDTGKLSALPEGHLARGAFSFGFDGAGLHFSQPVYVRLFVGTGYEGQTMSLLRS